MHGQFLREMLKTVNKIKTWEWTAEADLKLKLKH